MYSCWRLSLLLKQLCELAIHIEKKSPHSPCSATAGREHDFPMCYLLTLVLWFQEVLGPLNGWFLKSSLNYKLHMFLFTTCNLRRHSTNMYYLALTMVLCTWSGSTLASLPTTVCAFFCVQVNALFTYHSFMYKINSKETVLTSDFYSILGSSKSCFWLGCMVPLTLPFLCL